MTPPVGLIFTLLSAYQAPQTTEVRALAYLAREVPLWAAENRCHSCHHDGDGARALLDAVRRGQKVDPRAIEETAAWLMKPEGWSKNGGDGPFSDKVLAQIQFTSTLAALAAAGRPEARPALARAAERLAGRQAVDGSWPVEGDEVGSPTTYGKALATLAARDARIAADSKAHADRASRANAWLLQLVPANTPDASALAMAAADRAGEPWAGRRRAALAYLTEGQGPDGGWGPTINAPAEVFDTAIAALALLKGEVDEKTNQQILKARASLIAAQQADGGWPATTRPAGAQSYAQRVSTTAWATLALMGIADRR